MNLFETAAIGSLTLPGRFIRSAVPEGLAGKNGEPLPQLSAHYRQLTQSRAAAVISGPISVVSTGRTQSLLSLHSDRQIDCYRQLTQAVHDVNGTILAKLCYPSEALKNPGGAGWQQLRSLERSFSHAAARAKAADFDGIQLDFTCYSIPGCLLSPLYNQRRDEYGGDIHARVRFPRDIFRAVRRRVGPDYPIWICLEANLSRLSVQELLVTGQYFASDGADAIEVCGGFPPHPPQQFDNSLLPQIHPAEKLSRIVSVPVILTAGIKTEMEMQLIAKRSRIGFFGLDSQLEEDPGFIYRLIR